MDEGEWERRTILRVSAQPNSLADGEACLPEGSHAPRAVLREGKVFLGLARGRTAQEIADREVVSIYTIRAHTRSIYAKLDVHSKKSSTRHSCKAG